jgi:hypothetical protein
LARVQVLTLDDWGITPVTSQLRRDLLAQLSHQAEK